MGATAAFPKRAVLVTYLNEGERRMPSTWSHIITGISSVAAAVGFQRLIISMQDRKIEKACNDLKEALNLKQDSVACGLMNHSLIEKIGGMTESINRMNDIQQKMVTELAVLSKELNNNKK